MSGEVPLNNRVRFIGGASDHVFTDKKKPLHEGLWIGAGTMSRTRDLLITSQLLYQLSYAGILT